MRAGAPCTRSSGGADSFCKCVPCAVWPRHATMRMRRAALSRSEGGLGVPFAESPSAPRTCIFAPARAGAWEGRVDGLGYAQARRGGVASFT